MNVVELRPRLQQPLQLLVGDHRRLLPGAGVLRHRPVAGAALPVGALGHREPPGPALQRPVQGADAVRHPLHRRDGLRLLSLRAAADLLQRAGARSGSPQARTPRSLPPLEQRFDGAFGAAAGRRGGVRRRDARGARRGGRPTCARRPRAPSAIRAEAKPLVKRAAPDAETQDADYVFLSFVLRYVPQGWSGLLDRGDPLRLDELHVERAGRAWARRRPSISSSDCGRAPRRRARTCCASKLFTGGVGRRRGRLRELRRRCSTTSSRRSTSWGRSSTEPSWGCSPSRSSSAASAPRRS